MWHEGIAGRNATDVASAYIKCVSLCEKENIIFWTDNCAGQNKNWTLFNALVWCVNTVWGPQEITIKFLEKGHTFMRADSVHGSIGKALKSEEIVPDFDNFVDLCNGSSKSIKSVVLHPNDMYQFVDGHRCRSNKKVKLPLLASIVAVKFCKNSRSLFYKSDFDGQYEEVDFLKKKHDIHTVAATQEGPRGVARKKKESIIKILKGIPATKLKFWSELPVNDNSTDLVEEFE